MKKTMVKLGLSMALLAAAFGLAPRSGSALPYNPCRTFDNHPPGCYYSWSPQDLCCKGNRLCPDICY